MTTISPWYVASGINAHNQALIIAESTGESVAIAYKSENAPMIAAAPELLEALEILVDHAQERYPHFEDKRGQDDIHRALEVIAKARGQ